MISQEPHTLVHVELGLIILPCLLQLLEDCLCLVGHSHAVVADITWNLHQQDGLSQPLLTRVQQWSGISYRLSPIPSSVDSLASSSLEVGLHVLLRRRLAPLDFALAQEVPSQGRQRWAHGRTPVPWSWIMMCGYRQPGPR